MMKVINHAPPARRTTTWTTAAMAAASASANAELVQIDLIGNELLAVGTNGLFADLDGDGTDDIVLTGTNYLSNSTSFTTTFTTTGSPTSTVTFTSTIFYAYHAAEVSINGNNVRASSYGSGTVTGGFPTSPFTATYESGTGLIPISLSGQPGKNAWLQVVPRTDGDLPAALGRPDTGLYLTRVIYDEDAGGSGGTPDEETQYAVVGSTENGVFTPIGGDLEVASFSVSNGTATITIKGAPNTEYTCKSSTTLSGFTEIVPTSGSTTTDSNGDATFQVDASGPKRFYVIED